METTDHSKNDQTDKRDYRGGLLLFIGLLSVLPAVWAGHVQLQNWKRGQIDQSDRQSLTVAKLIARDISLQIDDYARISEAFAGQIGVRGLAPLIVQKMVTAHRSTFSGIAAAYVDRIDGARIAVDPPSAESEFSIAVPENRNDNDTQRRLHTGRASISEARMRKDAFVSFIRIAAPVHDSRGQLAAFSQMELDLNPILVSQVNRILSDIPDLKVVVLDREGRVLAHPEEEARREWRDLSSYPLFKKTRRADGEVRAGMGEEGTSVRAAVVPILLRDLDWSVFAYRTEASINRQATAAQYQIGGVMGAGLLGSFLLTSTAYWWNRTRGGER